MQYLLLFRFISGMISLLRLIRLGIKFCVTTPAIYHEIKGNDMTYTHYKSIKTMPHKLPVSEFVKHFISLDSLMLPDRYSVFCFLFLYAGHEKSVEEMIDDDGSIYIDKLNLSQARDIFLNDRESEKFKRTSIEMTETYLLEHDIAKILGHNMGVLANSMTLAQLNPSIFHMCPFAGNNIGGFFYLGKETLLTQLTDYKKAHPEWSLREDWDVALNDFMTHVINKTKYNNFNSFAIKSLKESREVLCSSKNKEVFSDSDAYKNQTRRVRPNGSHLSDDGLSNAQKMIKKEIMHHYPDFYNKFDALSNIFMNPETKYRLEGNDIIVPKEILETNDFASVKINTPPTETRDATDVEKLTTELNTRVVNYHRNTINRSVKTQNGVVHRYDIQPIFSLLDNEGNLTSKQIIDLHLNTFKNQETLLGKIMYEAKYSEDFKLSDEWDVEVNHYINALLGKMKTLKLETSSSPEPENAKKVIDNCINILNLAKRRLKKA